MKALVLGATGRTGSLIVERALSLGHDVRVLVRDPARLGAVKSKLDVIVGDALDEQNLGLALQNVDGVLVSLGTGKGRRADVASESARVLIPMLDRAGVHRVVVLSSFGVNLTRQYASRTQRLLAASVLRSLYADKGVADDLWQNSGLDWTLVYPVTLTNSESTGRYRAEASARFRGVPTIARSEVADFMVAQLDDDTWSRRIAILSGC